MLGRSPKIPGSRFIAINEDNAARFAIMKSPGNPLPIAPQGNGDLSGGEQHRPCRLACNGPAGWLWDSIHSLLAKDVVRAIGPRLVRQGIEDYFLLLKGAALD